MKAASIFSGIGAPESAWIPLGFEFVFNAEVEPFPCAVLKHHYPETENLGDVTNYEQWPDRHFHVLVGGSPCQSFSVAGLRKGLDDPRGDLMLTFGAIAARYRSDWFVWENVPGVLSSNGGRDFACFLGLLTGQVVEPPADGWENSGILSGINSAYGVAWRILDAQYFGVAQRRRRVFIVGHIGGKWQRAAAVLFERESLCGNPPPSRKKGKRIAGTFKACATSGGFSNSADHAAAGHMIEVAPTISARVKGGGGLGTDFDCDGGLVTPTLTCEGDAHSGFRDEHEIVPIGIDGNEVGYALRSNPSHSGDKGDGGVNTTMVAEISPCFKNQGKNSDAAMEAASLVAHSLRADGFDASEDGTGRGTPLVPEISNALCQRDYKGARPEADQGAPLVCETHAIPGNWIGRKPENGGNGSQPPLNVSPTLTKTDLHGVQSGMMVRRITPREAERLQGFPDDYTLIAIKTRASGKVNYSKDGPRYKALGNSMAVPVLRWIGQRIISVNQIP